VAQLKVALEIVLLLAAMMVVFVLSRYSQRRFPIAYCWTIRTVSLALLVTAVGDLLNRRYGHATLAFFSALAAWVDASAKETAFPSRSRTIGELDRQNKMQKMVNTLSRVSEGKKSSDAR
jgi:uncharacterized membrane-anchored protein